ncbi:cytochrome P450 [Streptomyces abikoensis]|uniref:Cytochrome P450 n=1 Tax=Streptomyces abikoensis TaxID=97398 RepID=A0ABW7TG79_9ACTN
MAELIRDKGRPPRVLPPGPAVPAIVQSLRLLRSPYGFLAACTDRYGEAFTLRISGFGTFVVVSGPESVRRLFTAKPDVLAAGQARSMLEPIFGRRSLLVMDGPLAGWQRRFLMPHFRGEENLMRARRASMAAARRDIRSWPRESGFPLYPRFESMTMDVIIECFLGLDVEQDRATRLKKLLLDFMHAAHASAVFHVPALIGRVDIGPWRRYRRLREEVDDALADETAARRVAPAHTTGDILGLLRRARRDEPIDQEETRDIVIAVIGAGHETVSIALAWAIRFILAHPLVEERVRAELEQATGGDELEERHLRQLTYLDAVIAESMRLAPLNPLIPRMVKRPVEIAGYVVPPGVHVAVNSLSLHRDPAAFPGPCAFRPERFLDAQAGRFAWVPFGEGARKCIGASFAEHEMKAILAVIMREFPLELLCEGGQGVVTIGDMAAPKGGTRVCRRRKDG